MSAAAEAERLPAPLDPLDPYLHTIAALAASIPTAPPRRARVDPLWPLLALTLVTSAAALVRHGHERIDDGVAPVAVARPAPAVAPSRPTVVASVPVRRIARLRVGQTAAFAVEGAGDDLQYRWSVDDQPAGSGARWTYVPAPAEVGRRQVAATVLGPGGIAEREWTVRVCPARPPRLVAIVPAALRIDVPAGRAVDLSIVAKPATPGERLAITWTVDGRPVGTGPAINVPTRKPGAMAVHVAVTSDLGVATTRDWRIDVGAPEPPPAEPPPPTPAAAPTSASSPPVTTPVEARPEAPPPAHASVTRAPAPAPVDRPAVPAAPGAPGEEQVKAFLDRYVAAWRARDIDALRRLGQVTNEEQATVLRNYFASIQDLEIEVSLLGIQSGNGRTVVRFVRRDRFKNPLGRLVTKESPPIERALVDGPDGLRFAPGS